MIARPALFVLALFFLFVLPARAMDVIEDENGRFWEGTEDEERSSALDVTLKLAGWQAQASRKFDRNKIRQHMSDTTMEDVYKSRASIIESSLPGANGKELTEKEKRQQADRHYRLGLWCMEYKKRLAKQAKIEFKKAVALVPDHKDAHTQLGDVFKSGVWKHGNQQRVDYAKLIVEYRDRLHTLTQGDWDARPLPRSRADQKVLSLQCSDSRAVWIEVTTFGKRKKYGLAVYNFASRNRFFLVDPSYRRLQYARLAGKYVAYLEENQNMSKKGRKAWTANLVVRDVMTRGSSGRVQVTDYKRSTVVGAILSRTNILWKHRDAYKKDRPPTVYAGALKNLGKLRLKEARMDLSGNGLDFNPVKSACMSGSRVFWVVPGEGLRYYDFKVGIGALLSEDERISSDPPTADGNLVLYTSAGRRRNLVYDMTTRKERGLDIYLQSARLHNGYVVGVSGKGDIVLYHIASGTQTVVRSGKTVKKPMLSEVCVVWREHNPKTGGWDVWGASPRVAGSR